MDNKKKAASLAALLRQTLGIDVALLEGKRGQFDVLADDKIIVRRGGNWFTRSFGAGYPDSNSVLDQVKVHLSGGD